MLRLKQDEDITNQIQRVITYVQRRLKDACIDEKTKQYLIQTNVKPGRFYILRKLNTQNRQLGTAISFIIFSWFHLKASLQDASHNSSTIALTLSSLPWIHTLKTQLTSLTNSLTSLLYLVTPYLSLSTFHHCTPQHPTQRRN